MGRNKKWESDADRVMACELRKRINPISKKPWTDAEIMHKFKYFDPGGFKNPIDNNDNSVKIPNNNVKPPPGKLKIDAEDTEDFDFEAIIKFKAAQGDIQALKMYHDIFYEDDKLKRTEEFSYYKRPDWLYPHQEQMINIMRKGNIFITGMRQLTGKTTGTLVACLEEMLDNSGTSIEMITSSMPLSRKMISKINAEDMILDLYKPHIRLDLKESYTLKNKSRLGILPCKPASVQGPSTDVLWLEEIDKTIKDKIGRETLGASFPQVIKKMLDGKGKVWATCNMGTTRAFHFFREAIMKLGGEFFPVVEIVEPTQIGEIRTLNILNEHVPTPRKLLEDREGFIKGFMWDILAALVDEQFANAMILNKEDFSKDLFKPELLTKAWESWDESKIPKFPVNAVMAVDVGYGHGTGVIALALGLDGHIHETYTKKFYGGQISEEKLKDTIAEKYVELGCRVGLCESNSGGLWWIDDWRLRGLNFKTINFGGSNATTGDTTNPTKSIERRYKERILKDLLEKGMIHLHSRYLFNEFTKYNPLENQIDGKGDIFDALLHCLFELVDGIVYLIKLNEKRKKVAASQPTAYVS